MTFPENIQERNNYILDCVKNNNYNLQWTQIISEYKGHVAIIDVMSDALKIEGTRVNVSAQLQQEISDVLDASFLTAKVADLLHNQAILKADPATMVNCPTSTSAMISNSKRIDDYFKRKYENVVDGMLASTVGKLWTLNNATQNKPGIATNYGWHFSGSNFQGITGEPCASLLKDRSGMYYRVIQGMGTCHNSEHCDYSQVCVLMKKILIVDGKEMTIEEVGKDDILCNLISHQGKILSYRQP